VSANVGVAVQEAPLQARAASVGAWEKFHIVDNGNATWGILSVQNGLYATANFSLTNAPLEARALTAGSWERFFIPGF
jgi:hypothetical protein